MRTLLGTAALIAGIVTLLAQQPSKPKPEDTEVWEPVPKVVTPGATTTAPPSDAKDRLNFIAVSS